MGPTTQASAPVTANFDRCPNASSRRGTQALESFNMNNLSYKIWIPFLTGARVVHWQEPESGMNFCLFTFRWTSQFENFLWKSETDFQGVLHLFMISVQHKTCPPVNHFWRSIFLDSFEISSLLVFTNLFPTSLSHKFFGIRTTVTILDLHLPYYFPHPRCKGLAHHFDWKGIERYIHCVQRAEAWLDA